MLLHCVSLNKGFWQNVESTKLYFYILALHDPWCLLCFTRRVSLAEYILVLSVYSHLLQITSFMMASARPVSILPGMRTNRWARFSNKLAPVAFGRMV